MVEAFIDAPQCRKGLTVFPLIASHGPVLPYLLSTEIHGSGTLTIKERREGGTPMLLARNNSLHALLIFAGEPLPGGSPGRLVERSVLLAGKHVTQIPPSSTEQGGWLNPGQEAEITDWLRSFPIQNRQVGLLGFHGDRALGLEALGSTNLYARLHRRLLIRFMKDAMAGPAQACGDAIALEEEAQKLVSAIVDSDRVATKRVGLGTHRLLTGPVSGAELTYEGHLVHLSARPAPAWESARSPEEGSRQCS